MNKKNLIISIALVVVAIVYTLLVNVVDVQKVTVNAIETEMTDEIEVGFATVNTAVANTLGYNNTCYKISKYLGYAALLFVAGYGLVGLMQLVMRKSFFKVDKEIYMLGGFYAAVLALYVLFEKVVINCRPIILDAAEWPEASFPSSHTLLALCMCGSALLINKKLFKEIKWIKIVNIIACVVLVGTVCTRFVSGVHWLTDIIGGIIISAALLQVFNTILNLDKKAE